MKTLPPSRQRLLRAALSNSSAQRQARRRANNLMLEPVSWVGRFQSAGEACLRWPLHALASALLWPKLRRQLSGGRLAYPISGGGAIAPHIDAFFEAVKINADSALVRRNRLNLLSRIRTTCLSVADLTKVEG